MTQPPALTVSIDAWISQWENIYAEASELGIAETQSGHRALYDFLASISSMSPFFSELWMSKILEAEENQEIIPFNLLTKRYRDSTKLVKPIRTSQPSKSPAIAHATYQGQPDHQGQQSQQGQQRQQNHPNQQKKQRLCPCESGLNNGMHRFNKCAYINPAVRLDGWTLDQDALKRFERANQHEGFRLSYENAI